MTVVPQIVGVMLPGIPTEGDPTGVKDYSGRRALNLTAVTGMRIDARRIGGVLTIRARVMTEFGDFHASLPEDQSKLTPNSWHTLPVLDI